MDARAALEAISEYFNEKKVLGDAISKADPEYIDGLLDPIAEKFAAAFGDTHVRGDK